MGNQISCICWEPDTVMLPDRLAIEHIPGRSIITLSEALRSRNSNVLEINGNRKSEEGSPQFSPNDDFIRTVGNFIVRNSPRGKANFTKWRPDGKTVSDTMRGGVSERSERPIDNTFECSRKAFTPKRYSKYASRHAVSTSEDIVITMSPNPKPSVLYSSISPHEQKQVGYVPGTSDESSDVSSTDSSSTVRLESKDEVFVMRSNRRNKRELHKWINGWENMGAIPGLSFDDFKSDVTLNSKTTMVSSKNLNSSGSSIPCLKCDTTLYHYNGSKSNSNLASSNFRGVKSCICKQDKMDLRGSDISDLSEPIMLSMYSDECLGNIARNSSVSFDFPSYSDLLSNGHCSLPHWTNDEEEINRAKMLYNDTGSGKALIVKSAFRTAFKSLIQPASKIKRAVNIL